MTAAAVELRERHAGQEHVASQAKRFNVLMCGRRFGKTSLGIDLASECAVGERFGGRVGWFAPTYKYLEEAWREIVLTLGAIPRVDKSEQEHRLALPTGGVIECWSLDSDDPGRGRFYDLAIIDEAGLVPNLLRLWNSAIRPTLADRRGSAWFLGTPKITGDFTAIWNLGQDEANIEWASWRMPMSANPYISPDEIEAMRLTMPEADFQREVLGLPIDDNEHPIGIEHIRACVAPLSEAEPAVWGVDLARSVDFTVALGLDIGGHVCRAERWKGPWGLTRSRLRAILGDAPTFADSTGVGDPIVEDLQRDGARIQGCVFTARFKQQIIEGLIAAIQQHRIRFPDGWLRQELESLTAERTHLGTRYAAPDGLHDDGVMALALAWHGFASVNPALHAPREREVGEGKSLGYDYKNQQVRIRRTGEEEFERMFARAQSRPLAGRHQIPRR